MNLFMMCCAAMVWSEGDTWNLELLLNPGQYEFKFVAVPTEGGLADWEPGENRLVEVGEQSREQGLSC